jgi:phosphatidylserine decarboxylase
MERKLPIASEGWPFIVGSAVIAAGLTLTGRRRLALPFWAASLASVGFFRDPEREIPVVPNGVLSPADGRVLGVEDAVDPFVGSSTRVSIFLSPLDVHVNRAPIGGLVADVVYTPGRFVAAYDPDAGDNERCAVRLQGDAARVTVVQIAGVIARRIVCRVGSGDKLAAGERFGMIRFGSRLDVYLPEGAAPLVAVGQIATGGETVLADLANGDSGRGFRAG